MSTNSPLLETAAKIVQKQPYLADWLFDNSGHIREPQRRQILAAAKLIYEQKIQRMTGISISDVVLSGSFANYYHTEDDDVNVVLLLNFDGNPYVKKDDAALEDFLFLSNHLGSTGFELFLNDRKINMTSAIKLYNRLGQYSVKNKKWINFPEFNTQAVSAEELISNYYEKISAFYRELQSYPLQDGKYSVEDCRKLVRQYLYNIYTFADIKDYLTHRLLRKTGKLRDMHHLIREIYASSLSY